MIEFVIGGARSGKSRYALQRAEASGKQCLYLATATAEDAEMQARIAQHQAERDKAWRLIEEPLQLSDALRGAACENQIILVDCLTLWLSNVLHHIEDYHSAVDQFIECLGDLPGDCILVNNEVGLGVVPMGELTRQFVDENGRLNQRLAALADRVVLLTAGIAQAIKS